jgi:hypothetical protein
MGLDFLVERPLPHLASGQGVGTCMALLGSNLWDLQRVHTVVADMPWHELSCVVLAARLRHVASMAVPAW